MIFHNFTIIKNICNFIFIKKKNNFSIVFTTLRTLCFSLEIFYSFYLKIDFVLWNSKRASIQGIVMPMYCQLLNSLYCAGGMCNQQLGLETLALEC
ncbi:unnamed protein product, partial [Vitis vinifera]|uniref:Uncharacterized protein n=1 Tax=Vitis vinifera TaxID=29760 RepID=D7TZ76_VITVI